MATNNPIKAIEIVNEEYLKLLNSPEYRMGSRICKLMNAVKRLEFKKILLLLESAIMQRRADKISQRNDLSEITTFDGDRYYNHYDGAVYTCITGGYEEPSEPIYKCVDFFLFTDRIENKKDSSWNYRIIDEKELIGNQINRYYKMNPSRVLPSYRFTVYVDGNVQVVSDITVLFEAAQKSKCGIAMHKHSQRECAYVEAEVCILYKRGNIDAIRRQIEKYRKEGFPDNFGLCEATIIVVDNYNPISKQILDAWWDEFTKSGSGRDQLSLPYVIWKCGYKMEDIGFLGDNLMFNPKFRVKNVGDHRYRKGI